MSMRFLPLLLSLSLVATSIFAKDPASAMENAGAKFKRNGEGQITEITIYQGKEIPLEMLQSIGEINSVEKIAINQPVAGDGEWAFLKKLPKLISLTIWHGHEFSKLDDFAGLPIERLTIGGCMGLRDLNKETPEQMRDAVLALKDLPNLTYANLYHSPTLSNDQHFAHLAANFPKLEEIKIDVKPPRGYEPGISPEGLQALTKLPLKVIELENASAFTEEHMAALAKIETLEALLIDNRRSGADPKLWKKVISEHRPEVDLVIAPEGTKDAPKRARK